MTSERAIHHLHLWLKQFDLLDGRLVDELTRLRCQSRVQSRSVIVVFDDDVAVAVHRAIVRTLDDDDIGTMMPAPMMAMPVVVERLRAMAAMMETTAVFIDDDCCGAVMMAVLIGRQNDRIGRGNGRRGNAERQSAQEDSGFQGKNSGKM